MDCSISDRKPASEDWQKSLLDMCEEIKSEEVKRLIGEVRDLRAETYDKHYFHSVLTIMDKLKTIELDDNSIQGIQHSFIHNQKS
jgi:hypothetical protein